MYKLLFVFPTKFVKELSIDRGLKTTDLIIYLPSPFVMLNIFAVFRPL